MVILIKKEWGWGASFLLLLIKCAHILPLNQNEEDTNFLVSKLSSLGEL